MCFCATASFGASAGLAAVGAASIITAKKEYRALAFIPILFAIQQFIEGSQWIAQHPSLESLFLGYAYLFFAFLLWPVYIPFAVYQIEKNQHLKRLIRWCIWLGGTLSAFLLYTLFSQPLFIEILPNGIYYNISTPLHQYGVYLYVLAACGGLFVSSSAFLRWFGVAGLGTALFSLWIFHETAASVWCFFAAMLSFSVYFFIRARNTNKPQKKNR